MVLQNQNQRFDLMMTFKNSTAIGCRDSEYPRLTGRLIISCGDLRIYVNVSLNAVQDRALNELSFKA